jgi:hypothetical protein
MKIKVTFMDRDPVLAAIVRSLVAKAAGFQAVSGTNEGQLSQHGFYEFELDRRQLARFKEWVEHYISEDARKSIRIDVSN